MSKKNTGTSNPSLKPTISSNISQTQFKDTKEIIIFGKQNYIIMGVGFLMIFLGMLLMIGGKMPNPNVWDDSLIYSFRRITLAPIMILTGLVLQIWSIFKKDNSQSI